MKRMAAFGALIAGVGACALLTAGCPHNGDSVVVTGAGVRLSSDAIDRDPLALLPSDPVAVLSLDARAFVASSFGAQFTQLAAGALAIGQDAGFSPQRDLSRAVVGVYVSAGINPVAVIQGTFQPDAIRAAADRQTTTPIGIPVVHSHYAGNDLYTANNQGFTIVTAHTALAGDETGMRRALDRIRDNRLTRELPDWIMKLMDNPQASLVAAADFGKRPEVLADLAQQWPFLGGLSSVRVLGNFQPPGVNFAGAITYSDAAGASHAADAFRALSGMSQLANTFRGIGISSPLQSLQVAQKEKDVELAIVVDGQAVTSVLNMAAGFLNTQRAPQGPTVAR